MFIGSMEDQKQRWLLAGLGLFLLHINTVQRLMSSGSRVLSSCSITRKLCILSGAKRCGAFGGGADGNKLCASASGQGTSVLGSSSTPQPCLLQSPSAWTSENPRLLMREAPRHGGNARCPRRQRGLGRDGGPGHRCLHRARMKSGKGFKAPPGHPHSWRKDKRETGWREGSPVQTSPSGSVGPKCRAMTFPGRSRGTRSEQLTCPRQRVSAGKCWTRSSGSR